MAQPTTTTQVAALLAAIRRGEARAVDELFGLLYPELHQLAHSRLRRSGSFTLLDTTSLVHESYLRLFKAGSLAPDDKGQFMAYAARVMRSVVVDFVRRRGAERRGGDAVHVGLQEESAELTDPREREVVRINEALQELAAIDERLVRVVEMRYFAGMTEVVGLRGIGRTAPYFHNTVPIRSSRWSITTSRSSSAGR